MSLKIKDQSVSQKYHFYILNQNVFLNKTEGFLRFINMCICNCIEIHQLKDIQIKGNIKLLISDLRILLDIQV